MCKFSGNRLLAGGRWSNRLIFVFAGSCSLPAARAAIETDASLFTGAQVHARKVRGSPSYLDAAAPIRFVPGQKSPLHHQPTCKGIVVAMPGGTANHGMNLPLQVSVGRGTGAELLTMPGLAEWERKCATGFISIAHGPVLLLACSGIRLACPCRESEIAPLDRESAHDSQLPCARNQSSRFPN